MVWLARAGQEKAPVATIYFSDGKVELIYGFNLPAQLILVAGLADRPASTARLLEPTLNRPENCLALGVIGSGVTRQDTDLLSASLDAVFVVPNEAIEQTARTLALAVTTPGEPGHPWCCDWNDIRSLVSGAIPEVGRMGSARAAGPCAATDAVTAALEHVGSVEHCRVLSLLTGRSLRGAQIKEVSGQIRSRLGQGEHIAGVHEDASVPEGTVQVDVFVFGRALPRQGSSLPLTVTSSATEIFEIPDFLRNG